MDLSIGIINFNESECLKRCLSSIYTHTESLSFEVVVVDNNSIDGSCDMVRKEFPEVKIVPNNSNLGFAKAVNQAIKAATSEFVFVCNEDIFLTDDIFSNMVGYLRSNPDVAAIGPKIVNELGLIELSFNKKCSNLIRCLLDSLFFYSYVRVNIVEKYLAHFFPVSRYKHPDIIRSVAWLSGAAFLLRKSATNDAGLMDEKFFLYCEDEDFFCRINRAGWKVEYFPKNSLIHSRGKSTAKTEYNWILESAKSKLHFYRKRYGLLAIRFVKLLLIYRLIIESLFLMLVSMFSKKSKAVLGKKLQYYFETLKNDSAYIKNI